MPHINYLKNSEQAKTYIAGKVIFDVGEPGEVMYYVQEGRVDIFYNGSLLENVEAGGFFGEMALIDSTERSASAVASNDCKLVSVDRDKFIYLVQETPTFALQVMQTMASRLRKMNNMA